MQMSLWMELRQQIEGNSEWWYQFSGGMDFGEFSFISLPPSQKENFCSSRRGFVGIRETRRCWEV